MYLYDQDIDSLAMARVQKKNIEFLQRSFQDQTLPNATPPKDRIHQDGHKFWTNDTILISFGV